MRKLSYKISTFLLYSENINWSKGGKAMIKNKKFIYRAYFFGTPIWSSDSNSIATKYDKGIYIFNLKK